MKNTKRLIALVLALILCLGTLAGCQQTPAETTAPPAKDTTAPANQNDTTAPANTAEPQTNQEIYPLDSDKVYKIAVGTTEDADAAWSSQLWQDITGVEVEYIEWTTEQLQTALATKELPDAIYYSGIDKALLNEYGQAGIFVNYADYLDYMPNFKKALEDYPDAINFVKAEDGSFYTLPRIGTTSTTHGAIYIRTDMMNAAGWDEMPATTEEFLQCMEDIQAHYSATDPEFTVFSAYTGAGYLYWASIANVLSVLYPSFGDGIRTSWDVIDGEVVFGATTDQYKRLMQYMNQIFSLADGKGFYLGKDIYTEDGNASKAHAIANHVAVSSHLSFLAPANFESGNIDMTLLSPLTSEWQSEKHFAAKSNYVWLANCINADLPEEDIITLVRWFDSFYAQEDDPFDAEGTLWGISYFTGAYGVDWTRDEEAGTYEILPHEGYETPSAWQLAINPTGGCLGLFAFTYTSLTNSGLQAKGLGTNENTLPYSAYWFDVTMMTLNEEEQATYSDYWTEIDTYITEKTAKYITGELDVEADWETFLSDLENLHLQDVIDAYQSAYDRFSAS